MEARKSVKPKRHKKKKSRTEVSSVSNSEAEEDRGSGPEKEQIIIQPAQNMTDTEVAAAFTKFYMQQATKEFEDDLDRVRGADDFKDDALQLLIGALQQGTTLFSVEEQRRVVMASPQKDGGGLELK